MSQSPAAGPGVTRSAFFSALFAQCAGVIELRAFPSKARCFAGLGDGTRGGQFIAQRSAEEDVYLGVATRRDASGGALAHCRHLGALFVDVDFKTTPEAEIRARLAHDPLPPSAIIHSGGGLHCYWFLREPLMLPTEAHRATALLRRLATHLGADLASAEPARILRVPGTWNHKPAYGTARPVRLEQCEPTRRYNASELDEWLPAERVEAISRAPFALPAQVLAGMRNTKLYGLARSLYAKGLGTEAVRAAVVAVNLTQCNPPLPEEEVAALLVNAATQPHDLTWRAALTNGPQPVPKATRWSRALSAPEFLSQEEQAVAWLEQYVVSPGALTEIFSPRGLGKSHLLHGILVNLARHGTRCLLLDRDNARREVQRRLRAWGAASLTATLRVMCRDDVPPLTDTKAWAEFPVADYDVVAIDSLDATAEGVGEQDSARPARAIAPILDLCHRADGPAVVVLGNVIKSGAHSRGSGVVEDRADIAYEVRDCTGFTPSGTKDWWLELPAAGAEQWATRATRRKRRETYRLAFVSSKFRIGEEPDPFVYELNLGTEPWGFRLCTDDILAAGHEARETAAQERAARLDLAAAALQALLAAPTTSAAAEQYLKAEHRLRRAEARALLAAKDGVLWTAQVDPTKPGRPKLWRALAAPLSGGFQGGSAAEMPPRESPALTGSGEGDISADRMDPARRKYPPAEPRMNGGDSDEGVSAAAPDLKGAPAPGEERL
jgi:hypothetical protein